jgi:hypothetical protein
MFYTQEGCSSARTSSIYRDHIGSRGEVVMEWVAAPLPTWYANSLFFMCIDGFPYKTPPDWGESPRFHRHRHGEGLDL